MTKESHIKTLLSTAPVEWKKLGEVLDRGKGTNITAGKMKKIHKKSGEVKIFAGGKTIAFVNSKDIPSKDINYNPSIIVKSRGFIEFDYYDKPFTHKNEMWSYYSNNNEILIKFVYYFLKTKERYFQHLGSRMQMPQISIPDTGNYKIPIPPIPVQEEIVRILDNFTQLTAELTAELTARKKQYEYYRDTLLTFGDKVEWKKLEEIGEFIRGNGLQKKDFSPDGFPCIHYGEIHTKYGLTANKTFTYTSEEIAKKLRKAQYNDLLLATTSEDDKDVAKPLAWLGDEIAISGDMMAFRHNQNVKYLAYYVQTPTFQRNKQRYITGTKVRRISINNLNKIKIPIPSLEEQARIVSILDKFDTLVNSISEGLPKEIQLRQKQYEYYRDLLLSFKK